MNNVIWLEDRQRAHAWEMVGKAWQDCRPECETCAHCKVDAATSVPFGQGWADLPADSECTLGDFSKDSPLDCPALQAMQREAAEEADDDVSDAAVRGMDSMVGALS